MRSTFRRDELRPPVPSLSEPDSRPPTLIVTGGPQDGATVSFDGGGERVLGSSAQASLRIGAGNVAPSHARLRWSGTQLMLMDAGSTSGTFVNGEKLTSPRALAEGDRIYLGPPGSSDSVSLLVCPPVESRSDELMIDAPPAISIDGDEPLVLDAPAGAPAFDFLAPPPSSESSSPSSSEKTATPPPIRAKGGDSPAAPPPPLPLKPPPGSSSSGARKAVKADYTTDVSIGGDRPREPVQLPPALRSPSPKRKVKASPLEMLSAVPKPVLIGGAAVVLLIVLGVAYMYLHAPPPLLLTVMPPRVDLGGTVTLTGEQFSSDPSGNTVKFGGHTGEVTSASDTRLTVTVPEDAPLGDVDVTIATRGGRSAELSCKLVRAPRVTALAPEVAMPGAEVVVSGKYLNTKPPVVNVAGRGAEIIAAEPTSIRFRVPADVPMIEGRGVPVSVEVGDETARSLNLTLGHLPMLKEVAPLSGPVGSRVTLKGVGFAADPAANSVFFAQRRALVLSSKPDEVVAIVPGLDSGGSQIPVEIRVESGGSTSSPKSFNLQRRSGSFTPRFFPEPVTNHPGHDHLLVSTDIAPVLVLSGKGDAASTVARALAVTDTLNSVVEAVLDGKASALEMREKPAPCVAIVGAQTCLITPTAEDVAAYDETWGSEKGARATARALTAHWTALLQDYMMLFVAKQRPFRVLETSARGRVLLEIYGEATRAAGPGNGVPLNMVCPMPTKWATSVRDMALVLPAETQSRAAAIEGLWSGKVEDGGTPRAIRVRIRLDRGKPTGSLSTSQGTLTMDTPLTDISYERGAVQFSARMAGRPINFQGSLQQGLMTGTLQFADSKQSAGQFTLSFVE